MQSDKEKIISDFCAAFQIARMYPLHHPQSLTAIKRTFEGVNASFRDSSNLVIGIVKGEVAVGNEIFFRLSSVLAPALSYLLSRGIERLEFSKGLTLAELSSFIGLLVKPKSELPKPFEVLVQEARFEHIRIGKLSAPGATQQGPVTADSAVNHYEVTLGAVADSFDLAINQEQFDCLALKFSIFNLLENLTQNYQEFLTVATIKRFDQNTFTHLLNVSILSMFVSMRIGVSRDRVLDIGIAGLFHDIGKVLVSRKIIGKPDKLTLEEFDKVKSHVIVGAEILLSYVQTLGEVAVVVCAEHHLKYDLSGYPHLSGYRKQHPASGIVALCDVYDALSQRRSYKEDYAPELIYELMRKDRGSAFSPELFDHFFSIMGVWPIGTLVVLNDNRVGVVREQSRSEMHKPIVQILDGDTVKMLDLSASSDKSITRSLNPLNEGKPYVDQAFAHLASHIPH